MRKLVLLGAILHFVIGAGHLACLFCLETVFHIYGINSIMDEIATHGAALPYLITVCIAMAFFLAGSYGLSVLGLIHRMPLQKAAVITMLIVFFGRTIWGLTMLIENFSWLEMSSTGVAFLLGTCYVPCLSIIREEDWRGFGGKWHFTIKKSGGAIGCSIFGHKYDEERNKMIFTSSERFTIPCSNGSHEYGYVSDCSHKSYTTLLFRSASMEPKFSIAQPISEPMWGSRRGLGKGHWSTSCRSAPDDRSRLEHFPHFLL